MKKIILAIAMMFSTSIFAASHEGTVERLYLNKTGGGLILLDTIPADCGDTGWTFQFTLPVATLESAYTDSAYTEVVKVWISMLLTARVSGNKIYVGYEPNPAGRCNVTHVWFG